MGIFYYIHSVALIEDLPLEEHYHDPAEFYAAADVAYSQVNFHISIPDRSELLTDQSLFLRTRTIAGSPPVSTYLP